MDKSRIIPQYIRIELQFDPIRISNRMRLQPRIAIHLFLWPDNRYRIGPCRSIVWRADGLVITVNIETGEVGGGKEGGEVELISDANDIFGWLGVWIWWHG